MTTTRTVEHRHIDHSDINVALDDGIDEPAVFVSDLTRFHYLLARRGVEPIYCNITREIVDIQAGFGRGPGVILQECLESHWRFVSSTTRTQP